MSALTEDRSWTVRCRRRLVVECVVRRKIQHGESFLSDDGPIEVSTLRDAEHGCREEGWTLHADGTATCPVCSDVWEGHLDLNYRGSTDTQVPPRDDEDAVTIAGLLACWDYADPDPHPDGGPDPDEIHGLDDPEVEYVPNDAPEDDR